MITGAGAEPGERLPSKLRDLPPERPAEVEDFVGSLRERTADRALVRAAAAAPAPAFAAVWDNPDDAACDEL
jgi:hypothetical protein